MLVSSRRRNDDGVVEQLAGNDRGYSGRIRCDLFCRNVARRIIRGDEFGWSRGSMTSSNDGKSTIGGRPIRTGPARDSRPKRLKVVPCSGP